MYKKTVLLLALFCALNIAAMEEKKGSINDIKSLISYVKRGNKVQTPDINHLMEISENWIQGKA